MLNKNRVIPFFYLRQKKENLVGRGNQNRATYVKISSDNYSFENDAVGKTRRKYRILLEMTKEIRTNLPGEIE